MTRFGQQVLKFQIALVYVGVLTKAIKSFSEKIGFSGSEGTTNSSPASGDSTIQLNILNYFLNYREQNYRDLDIVIEIRIIMHIFKIVLHISSKYIQIQ